jgi:hypothetical protein
MRQHARQHLEEQLRRLAQQRANTKKKLRVLARQTRQTQRYRHGEYVELAGLAHLDHGTLLGGLCELAAMLTDPECVARWKVQGEARLEALHRRKVSRRHPVSSVDKRTAHAKTETT